MDLNPFEIPQNVVIRDIIPGKLENSILIMGFPQHSFLGPMTCDYLVQLLRMKQVGYLDSDELRTTATTFFGIVSPSIRVHMRKLENGEYDSIVVISSWIELGGYETLHEMLRSRRILAYAHSIVDWIKEKEIDIVLVMDTIPAKLPEGIKDVFYVATTSESAEIAKELLGLKPFTGKFEGFYGALLNYSYERNVDLTLMLFPMSSQITLSSNVIRAISMIGDIIRVKFPEEELERIEREIADFEKSLIKIESKRARTDTVYDFGLYR